IPKTSREYANDPAFRKFRRQLFHTSLERILSVLRPYMDTFRITLCGDGHFRRVIYGLGPYIADYPEQALLACVVQGWCPKCTALPNNLDDDPTATPRSHAHTAALLEGEACTLKDLWDEYGIVGDLIPFTDHFPRADIHELLTPDLLHQIIKGTFKDHLVDWVTEYVQYNNTESDANAILADIDRRISAAPPFPGLRRFPQGRGFKQWTGNDSKGLMKVYLPAIQGHLPPDIVRAVAALINFCYLVRRDVIDEDAILNIELTLQKFHQCREAFRVVRPDGFSLPRQHSLTHYVRSITLFGAPNGLCSSITESKHIKAVKQPYRRSNKRTPLGQMLITNQRMDKLAAARVDFQHRGMLEGSGLPLDIISLDAPYQPPSPPSPPAPRPPPLPNDNDEAEGEDAGAVDGPRSMSEITLAKRSVRNVPRNIYELADYLDLPTLPLLTRQYLYEALNPAGAATREDNLPEFPDTRVYIFNSARAVYYAPSNLSGLGGMYQERIRASQSWYNGEPRYDCVFVGDADSDVEKGMEGLNIARPPTSSPLKSSQRCNVNARTVSPGPGQPAPKKARIVGNSEGSDVENAAPEDTKTQTASQPEDSKPKRARRSVGLPYVKYPTQAQAPLPDATHTIELIMIHLKQLKDKYEEEKGRKEAYEVEWRRAEADVKGAREEVRKLAEDLVARQFVKAECGKLATKLEEAEREIVRLREVLQMSGQRLIDSAVPAASVSE
ncbi:hypothetical protein H0H92_006933, partial [Tricholoma furcatifolium]